MEGLIPKPWELHPMLVHFPIAFLLGSTVLLLWTWRWPSEMGHRAASGLLLSGMIMGWLAAAAGGLAFFTVRAHTDEGHVLMYWHLGFGLVTLALFTWLSVVRWRVPATAATKPQLIIALVGVLALMITGYIGGSIVYHHGAGVNPRILAPEIRAAHSHQNEKGHNDSANEHSEQ